MSFTRTLIAALAALTLVAGSAVAAEADPLQAALAESKAAGKGLTFYVNGQAIAGVVVSVDDKYLVARSTASGTIVIRLDRLDGVAGHVTLGERK
ncbi:MAG TPA: hypothetical protein VFY24_03735 [Azospira sp.]|nr:hypothetical protein [Azospira sp.]